MFRSQFLFCIFGGVFAFVTLFAVSCSKPAERPKQSLYRQWLERVRSDKEDFTRRDALIEYFSMKWHSVSFEVTAEHLLASSTTGREEDRPWPFGQSERPLGEQEAIARRVFQERFGLEPPPYFPPALDAYDFMAPPWAEAVNRMHWEKALRFAGLKSLHDVPTYLERRKAPAPLQARTPTRPEAGASSSVSQKISLLLKKHPGSKLERLDAERHYMEIRLNEFLVSGSDAACAVASELLYQLSSLGDGKFIVKVTNDWVPSAVNPMDVGWARKLAGLGGAPVSLPSAKHQERVNQELRSRGILMN